jgi:cob(I)alamin adenosyltransferase
MKSNVGSGDRGITSLLSGERVPKSHERIETCGELDELASVLGALAASLSAGESQIRREIEAIEAELLHIGAWVATQPGSAAAKTLRGLDEGPLRELESSIERMEKELPPLQSFILPGGTTAASWAHVARTVCRRAERRLSAVARDDTQPSMLPYLNRLSTYLFVLARLCNMRQGIPDTPWKG